MKVTFIGTGYVGLVTGTCFAQVGHEVICVDVDEQKIQNLQNGVIPIYEPGLTEMVVDNKRQGRLRFTTDLGEALAETDVIFIGVGTPQHDDGSCNLEYVFKVVEEIQAKATSSKTVVVKSTVPVGTNASIQQRLDEGEIKHQVVSNPEFLREGFAVEDAMRPDRVVVGTEDPATREILSELYAPFSALEVPILFMKRESAEMTKYVANCVLATKISYINEMANICERLEADINDVRQGIGYDKRIGFQFFAPGAGYGGSCFPKDVRAMRAIARQNKMTMRILEAVDYVNEDQKRIPFQKLSIAFNHQLRGATIAVLGLAFKPETDDIREAPALVLMSQLQEAGAHIRAYDPEATENVRRHFGEGPAYCEDLYETAQDADAVVIMTEWNEFKEVDFARLLESMNGNVIIDGRNLFDPVEVSKAGFVYSSIGRASAYPGFTNQAPSDVAIASV